MKRTQTYDASAVMIEAAPEGGYMIRARPADFRQGVESQVVAAFSTIQEVSVWLKAAAAGADITGFAVYER